MKHKIVNLMSLTAIQVSNAALPLVIFPFALGIIGPERYAQVVSAEVLSVFLLSFVLYSFEVDGVSEVIGLDPELNREVISRIFCGITYLRIFIFLLCAPLVVIVALAINPQIVMLTLSWALVPLSYAIQPNWLYLGLESNFPVAAVTVLSRIAAVGFVLVAVRDANDFLTVPLAIGGFYVFGAICSLLYAVYRYKLKLVKIPVAQLKHMLWRGKEIFLGNLSVSLYRDVNVLILTALEGAGTSVAIYSMAEKLVKALQASIRPLNQLFFPKAVGLTKSFRFPAKRVFFNLLRVTWPQLVALLLVLFAIIFTGHFFGQSISWVRRIESAGEVAELFLLMSFAAFFGVANFMFGTAGLNALGCRRYLFFAIFFTGIASLAFSAISIHFVGAVGAGISFVTAEALLFFIIANRYFDESK